jgi:hypothetical protein
LSRTDSRCTFDQRRSCSSDAGLEVLDLPIQNAAVSDKNTLCLAGAPGIEPGPSVLETDMLAVEHHAPTGKILNDEIMNEKLPEHMFPHSEFSIHNSEFISLLCGACACDKIDRTYSAPVDPDHFSYFSASSSSAACKPYRPNQ